MSKDGPKLCKKCNHFPVHSKGGQGQWGLCLHALMNIDCTRWRLWK